MENNEKKLPPKAELLAAYEKSRPVLQAVLYGVENSVKSVIKLGSTPSYKSRVKSFESYYKKLIRIQPESLGRQPLPVLTDLIGIRIICAFLEDLAQVQKTISENFEVVEIERKGSDRTFSEFGYESLHILIKIPAKIADMSGKDERVQLPDGLVCELQIRTILQDAWAEVEHELVYKSEFSPFDKPLRRKLASVNASLSLADIIFQEIRDYQNKLNQELDARRATFYEKADILVRNQLNEKCSIDVDKPVTPVQPTGSINSEMPYVRGTIDDMILDAIHAHNAGDLEKAESIYTMIINAEPQPNNIVLSVIYKHRGMAFFAQNKYEEALADFMESVKHDDTNFRSFYYIGIVYSLQGKNEEAIEYFDKSLARNEYQSHVLYRRALTQYYLRNYDEAAGDLVKAHALGLDNEDTQKLEKLLSAQKEMKF